jgi:hypothetical protein
MSRLVWNETLDGWFGGDYQIELVAPQLWVLTRRKEAHHRHPGSELVRTSGSLSQLKQHAEELERRRSVRRRLIAHLSATISLIVIIAVGSAFGMAALALPALAALFVAGLRTLVIWVEEITGGAWSVLSQGYQ